MFYWIIKIFALVTCLALLMGLAAESTTLMGDAAAQNTKAKPGPNSVGIMLGVPKPKGNPPKCQAYAWNTDYPQRPGAIVHGAFYHALTLLGFLAMLVHQGLRGLAPNSLPTLFRFVPSLQGQWGLWATGAIMFYVGLQIMSYSAGALHLITAGILILVGCMNFCAGFFSTIASANAPPPMGGMPPSGPDPYMDDMYGPPPPPMNGPPGGGGGGGGGRGGGGGGGDAPPDPRNDGVGAGAAPPGMFNAGARTSGGIPSRNGAKFGGGDGSDDDDDSGQMVFDPRTGLWTKDKSGSNMPINPYIMPGIPMPMGYDMYGRPVMAPATNPYASDEQAQRSSRSMKKAIRKQARKELEKIRRLDEEDEADVSDDDDHYSEREARKRRRENRRQAREDNRKQREYERQIREEEKRQQMIAKGIAKADAKQRAAEEVAQEDARMKNYEDMLDNQREMAMTEAQRTQFQDELDQMREQQMLIVAKRKAELDAQERARQDELMYRAQTPQYRAPQYPRLAAASYVSDARSLPPYTLYSGQYSGQGQPLGMAGQRSQPPSYYGYSQQGSAADTYPPSRGQQQYRGSYSGYGQQSAQQPPIEECDFEDDITEIQSVRSETSSQRHLIQRRMQEERERVIEAQAQERERLRNEEDIIDGYRTSFTSGSSRLSSLRTRQPRW